MVAIAARFALARGRVMLVGVMLAAAVALMVSAVLADIRRDSWDRARDAAANLARAVERDLSSEIRAIDLTLRAVSDLMARTTWSRDLTELRHDLVIERLSSSRYLDAVVIVDEQGEVVFNTRSSLLPPTANLAESALFTAHRDSDSGHLYVGAPYRSRLASGLWSIGFSRRLTHPDGSFGGVAIAAIRVEQVQAAFEGMRLGSRGTMTLLRRDGIVLARNPADAGLLGRDLSGASSVRRMLAAPSGEFVAVATIDGVERLYTFRHLEGAPLFVSVALAISDIYDTWWRKAAIIGGLTGILVASMLGAVYWLDRELARRRAAELEARSNEATFRLLAESSNEMVSRTDLTGKRIYVSPAAAEIFGRTTEDMLGRSALDDVVPEDIPLIRASIRRLWAGERVVTIEYRARRPGGELIWIEASARTIVSEATGKPEGYVTVGRDITERKRVESRLSALAHTDALTGLANRRALDEVLDREWQRARRDEAPLSLLLIDADHFKLFNDSYGHPAGDSCLRRLADAAARMARRPADLVARYGGEEFAILLPGTEDTDAMALGERLRSAIAGLHLPHENNRPAGVVTVSIGVATARPWSDRGSTPAALVAAADAALYRAKDGGRNCVAVAPRSGTRPNQDQR